MTNNSIKMPHISSNIKKIRLLKNMSQDKLSKQADVAYNTIIKIESGTIQNPTIQTLSKIAKALDVTVNDLISEL